MCLNMRIDCFCACFLQSDTKLHEVTQFHIQNWNPQGKCTNMQTIIAVVEEVIKVQRRTGNNPIVVHCRYVSQ